MLPVRFRWYCTGVRPLLLSALIVCSACAPQTSEADVAFLVPLEQSRDFLTAGTPGSDGVALLPRDVFDQLHPLTVVDEPDALYAALDVVSVRLDPCFQEGASPSGCQPQLRLVLQPVVDGAAGLTTRDAAVHVFFATDDRTLKATVRRLAEERTRANGTFAQPAWRNAARAALISLISRNVFTRVTQMSVHASNEAWVFGGYDVTPGGLTPIRIATLGDTVEGHVTSTGATTTLAMTIDPLPAAEPALPALLEEMRRAAATTEAMQEAARALERLQDPAVHNPGTVDCSSCHAAATATRFLASRSAGPQVNTPVQPTDVFTDTRNLRAFGYYFAEPAISPRVAREITAVRQLLSGEQ